MRRMKLYEAIGLATIVGLTALAGVSCGKTQATTSQELSGVTWVLESYGSADNLTQAVEDKETTMTFNKDEMTVAGSGGVNSYGGAYTVKGNELTITNMQMTLMAGAGPIMEQEGHFFKILGSAKSYKIDGGKLTITGDEGVLNLIKK